MKVTHIGQNHLAHSDTVNDAVAAWFVRQAAIVTDMVPISTQGGRLHNTLSGLTQALHPLNEGVDPSVAFTVRLGQPGRSSLYEFTVESVMPTPTGWIAAFASSRGAVGGKSVVGFTRDWHGRWAPITDEHGIRCVILDAGETFDFATLTS